MPVRLVRPGAVENFAARNNANLARLGSVIRDWDELNKAVDALLANQREFVNWWDRNVRPRGSQANVSADLLTVAEAEKISGLTQQHVSRWRTRLADEEEYRAAIIFKARKEAGFELADPAAARGQPNREGPDYWATPRGLINALVERIVPKLPPREIVWECATGDRRLELALHNAGRFARVVGTDLYPQAEAYPRGEVPAPVDFLKDDPPREVRRAYVVTNGPFSKSDEFIARGLELLDAGRICGLVLLLRHDHLMAGAKIAPLNRATLELHCNWRPVWIPETIGNPRWGFAWVAWGLGPRLPPLYVSEPVEEDDPERRRLAA